MIKTQFYSSYSERDEIFAECNLEQSTWVVSDLQSKLDLQSRLLSSMEFLEEDSILRVNELWQKLLVRYLPHYRLIPRDLALGVCREKLKEVQEDWIQRPGVTSLIFNYIRQLMPLLSHPEGRDVLKNWFVEKPEAKRKWQKWSDLSYLVWTDFNERRLLAPDWVSGALLNSRNEKISWDKKLVVDLGANLSSTELELFRQISKNQDVEILVPAPSFAERFRETLVPYRSWLEECEREETPMDESRVEYLRFSTMVAEVKNAVAQVRLWLEEGVPLSRVAIFAPDIEAYWFALRDHLNIEGIPVRKKAVGRLQTLPSIQAWLAEIRLRRKRLTREDLETRVYSETSKHKISYEQFERLFKNTYRDQDILRSQDLAKLYTEVVDEQKLFSQEEFIAWSLRCWQYPEDIEPLELVVQRLGAEIPHGLSLSLFEWCCYLESHVSRIEFEIEAANSNGIFCNNLSSANHSLSTHRIYLGATESALTSEGGAVLSVGDVLSLSEQTGFQLSYPDSKVALFDLQMQCLSKGLEVKVSFAETNFSGAVQAPSIFWLEGRTADREAEERDVSLPTRLDTLMTGYAGDHLEQHTHPRFAREKVPSLSATSLERYRECPFRFAAEKIFNLSDLPSLDLDVDRMTRGALLHKVFEKVLPKERKAFSLKNSELEGLIDEAYVECETQLVDERLWPPLREKYMVLARRFLNFEKEWQESFPKTQTLGREERVQGYIEAETAEFSREKPSDYAFQFRGSIDRVDSNGDGQFSLLDYKSSLGSLRQYSSWRSNGQYQMALYAMAFEKGLTQFSEGQVVAGLYYAVKEMKRDTGFLVSDAGEDLFSLSGRARNKLTSEEKEQFFTDMKEDIRVLTRAIREGEFAPEPEDEKICKQCRWKKLCRAPHLN